MPEPTLVRERFDPLAPEASREDSALGCARYLLGGASDHLDGPWPLGRVAGLLKARGIPSEVERACSLEDLAVHLESGRLAVLLVNGGELWGWPAAFGNGEADSAVLATAIVRQSETREIVEVRLVAPNAVPPGRTTDGRSLCRAWLDAGGILLSLPAPAMPS